MDLEQRISRLEDRIGVAIAIPPLVVINAMNCEKNSTDRGTALMAIIPGRLNGKSGIELIRDQDETETNFLERCEAKYDDFYS